MTIERTFKLTIRDQVVYLADSEVKELYEQCRKALNISYVKFPPTPSTPTVPTNPGPCDIPYPYDTYPWYTPKNPPSPGYPYWTSPNTTTTPVEGNYVMDTYWHTNVGTNQKSTTNTTGINFLNADNKK